MLGSLHLTFRLLFIACVLLLAACGGEQVVPTPEPIPTAVETEAPVPTTTSMPTVSRTPTASPEPEPTPTTASTLAVVEIGELASYTHPTDLFTMTVPAGWDRQDSSKADEVIIIWTDQSNNALIGVDIFENADPVSQEQLTDFLQSFLRNTFGSNTDFTSDPPVAQPDGSVLIVWGYTAEASNGVAASLIGNSFIEQRGNKISILTTLVPLEQFDALLDDTSRVINSYRVNQAVAIDGENGAGHNDLLEVQLDSLEPYRHPSGVFSLQVPASWQINDNSTPNEIIQIWTEPNGNAFISINLFENPNAASSDELGIFLNDYLRETFADQDEFIIQDPQILADGSVLIVWGYEASTPVGNIRANMTGNSFIDQRGDKISILTLLAPQSRFDALQERANTIINSYQLDPDIAIGGQS